MYAHGPEDLRSPEQSATFKTLLCKDEFKQGGCKYGDRCYYRHVYDGVGAGAVPAAAAQNSTPPEAEQQQPAERPATTSKPPLLPPAAAAPRLSVVPQLEQQQAGMQAAIQALQAQVSRRHRRRRHPLHSAAMTMIMIMMMMMMMMISIWILYLFDVRRG